MGGGTGAINPNQPTPAGAAAPATPPTTITNTGDNIIAVTNPKPGGNDTASFTGRTFPLHRGNDAKVGRDIAAGIRALRLPQTINQSWGGGTIDVTFSIAADGNISDVQLDISQFTLADNGQSIEDFATWVSGRLANLRFAPQAGAEPLQVQLPLRL